MVPVVWVSHQTELGRSGVDRNAFSLSGPNRNALRVPRKGPLSSRRESGWPGELMVQPGSYGGGRLGKQPLEALQKEARLRRAASRRAERKWTPNAAPRGRPQTRPQCITAAHEASQRYSHRLDGSQSQSSVIPSLFAYRQLWRRRRGAGAPRSLKRGRLHRPNRRRAFRAGAKHPFSPPPS